MDKEQQQHQQSNNGNGNIQRQQQQQELIDGVCIMSENITALNENKALAEEENKEADKLKQNSIITNDKLALLEFMDAPESKSIGEEGRQPALDGLKQQMVEMAIKEEEDGLYNMEEDSTPTGNNGNGRLLMPLELHCELFAWLPLCCQLRLAPTLCRAIWALKGREVKRKWLASLNKWHQWDNAVVDVSADGRTAKQKIANSVRMTTVRARNPFLPVNRCSTRHQREGVVCYFEVKMVKKTGVTVIGMCDKEFELRGNRISLSANSFGMNPGGYFLLERHRVEGPDKNLAFEPPDVIGCGMECANIDGEKQCRRQLFFTKNGTYCSKPIMLPLHANQLELFPAVTLCRKDNEIKANFGQEPFKYNLSMHTCDALGMAYTIYDMGGQQY